MNEDLPVRPARVYKSACYVYSERRRRAKGKNHYISAAYKDFLLHCCTSQ